MADLVVQTTSVHDIGAALYGVLEAIDVVGDRTLAAEVERELALQSGENSPLVNDEDTVRMLATFEGWRRAFMLPMPDIDSDKLSGRGLLSILRKKQPRKATGQRVPVVAPRAPIAGPRAIAATDNGDGEGDDEGEGDDDDEDDTQMLGDMGFIGGAIRAALVGARVLLRRVGAKRALAVVGMFAKRASASVLRLLSTPSGKALALKASKYLAVGGAIAIGGDFAAGLARRIGGGAGALGKGALWLVAAYAAWVVLNQQQSRTRYK